MKSSDVAAKLGWPASKQTRLEYADRSYLHAAQLKDMSQLLDFPEKYFQQIPPASLSPEDLLFRAPVATPKKEKAYLAEFARSVGEVLEWLDDYHRLPPVKIPSLPPNTSTARAASEVRRSLGLAEDQPIAHLTHLAERAGVPVVMRGSTRPVTLHDPDEAGYEAVTEKHLGYSAHVGQHGDRPVTVIRANHSWERVRWTVAHEIGHVTLHARGVDEKSEDQANSFASELLAPARFVKDELPTHVTLASLTELKLKWGISLGALIIHLNTNRLIDSERFETLRRQLYTRTNSATGRTWGRDEPGWDAREVERPRLLATWMERCLGVAAPHAIAQLSGLWPSDIIASMISGQREKSANSHEKPAPKPGVGGNVVELDRWRREA
ncbi:ImmA/IrrE family metallo-endopeptidase [Micromonospora sp. URMC 107]|uniref:ImmA/IrrE family metallo-endopeptidase n=1 Tax=Micromonospora sp. URMC 107 TaxID=3423418 RepID=UPI003F1B3666